MSIVHPITLEVSLGSDFEANWAFPHSAPFALYMDYTGLDAADGVMELQSGPNTADFETIIMPDGSDFELTATNAADRLLFRYWEKFNDIYLNVKWTAGSNTTGEGTVYLINTQQVSKLTEA